MYDTVQNVKSAVITSNLDVRRKKTEIWISILLVVPYLRITITIKETYWYGTVLKQKIFHDVMLEIMTLVRYRYVETVPYRKMKEQQIWSILRYRTVLLRQ